MKLTKPQKDHLLRIIAAHNETNDKGERLPAGWFGSKSEIALEEKGLIRHWEETRPMGGGGVIGLMKVTWKFCEPTEIGWHEGMDLLGK